MENTFLRIARIALLGVTSLALLVATLAAVYSAFELRPAGRSAAPKINIKLLDMTTPESAQPASISSTPVKRDLVNKECQDATNKVNRLNATLGWEKRQQSSYNPGTMQFETTTVLVNNVTLNPENLCRGTRRIIDEQNSKLEPFIKKVDLTDPYYTNLNSFLDQISNDSARVQAFAPNDDKRYTVSSSLEWFNEQFERAVGEARDTAENHELSHEAAKLRGKSALSFAVVTFSVFFTCCLIIVFLRIDNNLRDLVAVTQQQQRPPNTPTGLPG
jgi:hypothetical protein